MQVARFRAYSQGQNAIVTAIILVGSVNALSYNVVHYLMIQMTSAVTTTVLGEVKIVGLLVLSVMLLGKLRSPCEQRKACISCVRGAHVLLMHWKHRLCRFVWSSSCCCCLHCNSSASSAVELSI